MVLRMPLISAEHWHSPSCIAYEDPTIYDGVLFWWCADGQWRNDWPPGSARWHAAEALIEQADHAPPG